MGLLDFLLLFSFEIADEFFVVEETLTSISISFLHVLAIVSESSWLSILQLFLLLLIRSRKRQLAPDLLDHLEEIGHWS